MTNKVVVENKISSIKKYLKILEGYQGLSKEDVSSNVDKKGAVERYLYLVSQATIDLAEALVSQKGFRKPNSYSEAFTILAENGVIDHGLEDRLIKMTGFRNALAHAYDHIDQEILHEVLNHKLGDILEFVEQVN